MAAQGVRSTLKYPFPVSSAIDEQRMYLLVERFWKRNRTAVGPDTDKLVNHLCDRLSAEILEAKSGSECLTWKIPKRWIVRKGQLREKNGTVIADFSDNPLHLWTHSIPFTGEIARKELIENHVYTDPRRPDEIPYHYRNGYRYDASTWGFSLPYRIVERLQDPVYDVEIDADLDNEGSLKVVDAFIPGHYKDTIFIMAHTCHPALVSDGLANIAVASEIYHYLHSCSMRNFSYRFLFGPEYFAAAAYLSKANPEKVDNLTFGIYLDMLSNHEPLGFQASVQGDSRMDKVTKNVVASHAGMVVERPYRGIWGNDETFYNGPGFGIPTIGLCRCMHREYHYHTDDIKNMDLYHMLEAAWVLQRIVEVFETDFIPLRKFSGPIYLSRFNLYVDPAEDREGLRNIEKIQILMDNQYSCMDIADELNIDFFFVRDLCNKLHKEKLIEKLPRIPRKEDSGTIHDGMPR